MVVLPPIQTKEVVIEMGGVGEQGVAHRSQTGMERTMKSEIATIAANEPVEKMPEDDELLDIKEEAADNVS